MDIRQDQLIDCWSVVRNDLVIGQVHGTCEQYYMFSLHRPQRRSDEVHQLQETSKKNVSEVPRVRIESAAVRARKNRKAARAEYLRALREERSGRG
jgi:hypothetical protein